MNLASYSTRAWKRFSALWCTDILVYWCTGVLFYCFSGLLVYWYTLVCGPTCSSSTICCDHPNNTDSRVSEIICVIINSAIFACNNILSLKFSEVVQLVPIPYLSNTKACQSSVAIREGMIMIILGMGGALLLMITPSFVFFFNA